MKKHQKIVRKNNNNETQTIYHLNDGRFCYYDPIMDTWLWLLVASDNPSFIVSSDEGVLESNNGTWQPVTVNNNPICPDQLSNDSYYMPCNDPIANHNYTIIIDDSSSNSNHSDHSSHHDSSSYDSGNSYDSGSDSGSSSSCD